MSRILSSRRVGRFFQAAGAALMSAHAVIAASPPTGSPDRPPLPAPGAEALFRIASDNTMPPQDRLAALQEMVESGHPRAADAILAAAHDGTSTMRSGALPLLVKVNGKEALPAALSAIRGGPTAEQQAGMAALGALQAESVEAQRELEIWFTRLEDNTAPAKLHLEILEAARLSTDPALVARIKSWETKVVAEKPFGMFRLSLHGGNAQRGEEIFHHHPAAQCARCHAPGGGVGPELDRIGERNDLPFLLESLLVPNARIAPGFGVVSLQLQDGSTWTGVPLEDTPDHITLRLSDGQKQTVPRARVKTQTPADSLMPPASTALNPAQIRDLVAYLASRRKDIFRSSDPTNH